MPESPERGALTEAVFYILLALHEPTHGYGIMKFIKEISSERVILGSGTLYGAITTLLKKGWMPAHPTLFLKKEVYRDCGNFDKSYKIAADYDFMLRVLRKSKYKFGFLPQVVTKMRMGGESNKKIANIVRKSKEDFRAMKSNQLKNPLAALFLKNVSKLNGGITKRLLRIA